MFVRCVTSSGRSLCRVVSIGIFSTFVGAGVGWADNANTGGGTETAAGSSGSGTSEASQNTQTTSFAGQSGKTVSAGTSTRGWASAGHRSRHGSSNVDVETGAFANAMTLRNGVSAEAGAGVYVGAWGGSNTGSAAANLNGMGYAAAFSIGGRMGAFASSGTDTFAAAISGRRGGLTVSAANGNTSYLGIVISKRRVGMGQAQRTRCS